MAKIHSLVDSSGDTLDMIKNPMYDINDERLISDKMAQLLKPELIKMPKSPFNLM
jgi:hypothetical protein